MQSSILNTETLNANDFTFKYKNVDGKHQVSLRNATGAGPIFWSPWLICPFGISSYMKSKGSTDTLNDWKLDLKMSCYENLDLTKLEKTFDSNKNKDDINHLIKFFSDLENKAIDFAHANTTKLFKKELKREIIEEACISKILKKSDKKDASGNFYPDMFATKIMKNKEGLPDIVVEDFEFAQSNFPTWESIEEKLGNMVQKGTPLRAILQIRAYFVNSKLGFTIKLCAIQVDDKKKNVGQTVLTFRERPVGLSTTKALSPPTDSDTDVVDDDIEVDEEEVEVA